MPRSNNVALTDIGLKHRPSASAQMTAKRIVREAALKLAPEVKPSKYGAKRCEIDGIKFDSHAEGRHYVDLKMLQRAGKISGLECHPKFELSVGGRHIAWYSADFRYEEVGKGSVIVDVKSKPTMTPVSRLKIRLFEACYPTCKVVIVQ